MENTKPVLYIFSGLPGVGKSTLAQYFAEKIHAVYIRIDTIEQGIRDLCKFNVQGEGYRLAYRIVEDNLKIGNSVISDQCNTIKLTREEWKNIALKNNCEYMNIEILCSNKVEHKNRIENRKTDVEIRNRFSLIFRRIKSLFGGAHCHAKRAKGYKPFRPFMFSSAPCSSLVFDTKLTPR